MQEIHPEHPGESQPRRGSALKRTLWVVAALIVLILMAVLPPLLNVSRYERRIAASISESLGRPVRFDSVILNVLPLPGFEIANFVVGEDPDFGSEPIIRANTVRATLRISSLWRRRIEFSKISFTEPSVNLVHLPDGRWNIGSILLQAAKIQAAPTAQKSAGEAPRFPYIEATDARLNLKQGSEKLPIALTEAEFALWLANPEQWQLRLEAHPARTDTGVSDTGTLRVEGTLGRAAALRLVPIDLKADWNAAPLGAVSWILMGQDAGLRGDMHLAVSTHGTVGENAVAAHLQVKNARRADFVPASPLTVDVQCKASALSIFHTIDNLECAWPANDEGTGLKVSGSIPDAQHPASALLAVTIAGVPASALIDGLRVASGRTPDGLKLTGTLDGAFTYPLISPTPPIKPDAPSANTFRIANPTLGLGDGPPFVKTPLSATIGPNGLTLAPLEVDLGGKEPATLEGLFQLSGYTLHLSGTATHSRLTDFGDAIPQIGDGLLDTLPKPTPPPDGSSSPAVEVPLHLDLTAQRQWASPQLWTETAPAHPTPGRKPTRRR